ALAQGSPKEERFEVGAKLGIHPARAGFVRVDARHGKRARTRFQVLERFAGWTLLHCELLTDRPHQIRVHLQNLGLPLAGDSLYGGQPLLLSDLKSGYHLKPHKTELPGALTVRSRAAQAIACVCELKRTTSGSRYGMRCGRCSRRRRERAGVRGRGRVKLLSDTVLQLAHECRRQNTRRPFRSYSDF